jgi:ATP-dependent 26S proteasome regulatory subunit
MSDSTFDSPFDPTGDPTGPDLGLGEPALDFGSPPEPAPDSHKGSPMTEKKTVETMLTDPTIPKKMRLEMIRQVAGKRGDAEDHVLGYVLEAASVGNAGQQYVEKTKELAERIKELSQGPMRCAVFYRFASGGGDEAGDLGRRAEVILPDGGTAFCAVPNDAVAGSLQCGDTVWLDAQGTAVLHRQSEPDRLGEEARLERRVGPDAVEVSVGEIGRYVFRTTHPLKQQLDDGEVSAGAILVVCLRRMIAWRALPPAEGEGHLRYLAVRPPPDVRVGRDVGAPPAFIEKIADHVERELTRPDLGERFRLRRSRMLLASGVAGSGKSHAIKALWRRLYEVMSEVTGAPIEELPARVFTLKVAEVLSKWLGDSDKNIARFFDEVAGLAGERFVAPDGSEWELPVLVVCEEIDALARQRGEDSVHDRIQTTLLEKLDPAQALFRDRLVIVVCTTNIPSALDVAFVRRAGGTIAHFGRLGRFAFRAVLGKQLQGRPFAAAEGLDVAEDEARRQAISDLTGWLFARNGADPGQVEITYVGQPNAVVMHRRDFLTAGLVDRAVQQAAGDACNDEWTADEPAWLDTRRLMTAIDEQVRAIVDQLTPGNCDQYLTLPDATRVATVRRIEQPVALPEALERAS